LEKAFAAADKQVSVALGKPMITGRLR
jgi:hypothetical protein